MFTTYFMFYFSLEFSFLFWCGKGWVLQTAAFEGFLRIVSFLYVNLLEFGRWLYNVDEDYVKYDDMFA